MEIRGLGCRQKQQSNQDRIQRPEKISPEGGEAKEMCQSVYPNVRHGSQRRIVENRMDELHVTEQ